MREFFPKYVVVYEKLSVQKDKRGNPLMFKT